METVTKDEWLILDTLTDNLEGIAQISTNVEDSIPAEKVNAIIYELCQNIKMIAVKLLSFKNCMKCNFNISTLIVPKAVLLIITFYVN